MLNVGAATAVNTKEEAARGARESLAACWTSAGWARGCGRCGAGGGHVSAVGLDCCLMGSEFTCFTIFQLLPRQLPSSQSECFCFCEQLCAVLSRLLPTLLIPLPETSLLPGIKTESRGCREIKSGHIFCSMLLFFLFSVIFIPPHNYCFRASCPDEPKRF